MAEQISDGIDVSSKVTSAKDQKPQTEDNHVKLWAERTSNAKRNLDDWAKKQGVLRVIDEYNGEFKTVSFYGLKGRIQVPPINDIFAFVDADLSNTYNRDPHLSVNPKQGTVIGAKLWEVRINYLWRKLRTKDEVEPEIIDKDLCGFAWHKVGRDVETDGAGEDLKIVKDDIYSQRVDWDDVVFNIDSKKAPFDCMWMAQKITKPLSFIKKKYPAAVNLKGTKHPDVSQNIYKNSEFKDDISQGVIWEIWDKEDRMIYLIADGLEKKFLADPRPWPEYMEEFPFIYYWDSYAPGMPRPMSAILPWEPQVWEKMVLLAAAVNHSKRWNRQALVKTGSIDEKSLDMIERGDDGAIINYTGTGDLDKNLKLLDWGTLPTDFYLLMDRLSAIQRDVSGQPEFERGGVTKTSSRTDAELERIAQGAKGRMDRRIDRFETHLENIARHMMMHMKADFDMEESIKVTGWAPEELIQALGDHFDPVTGTVTYTPEEIEGEYDVEVKSGSTLPLNNEAKGQIIEHIIDVVGKVGPGGASPLLRALIAERLDEFDMKVLKEAFAEEQKQMDAAAQSQQQTAQANDAKSKSQAMKNVASADKTGAEADALRLTHPFAPGVPSEPHPPQVPEESNGGRPEPPRVSVSFKSELPPDSAVEFAETGQVTGPLPHTLPKPPAAGGSGDGQ